jgi:lauroyl/myristoyl acyltransferase
MTDSLRALRRTATRFAIAQAIAMTARLPIGLQGSAVRSMLTLVGSNPLLRRHVRENMRLALGRDAPAGAERLYFRHLGWFLSNALPVFHQGLAATRVAEQVKFDQSIHILDEAVAERRGVVFTSPHWSGHELMAAVVNRIHPMAMLVRQASTAEQAARKLQWYSALGAEIVLRAGGAATIKDAAASLRALKSGRLLAITPDLLAGPEEGVEVRIFRRPARLHGGAFAFALAARAPVICGSCRWQDDSSVMITFERAAPMPDTGDRASIIRAAAQDWCRWLEDKLAASPENWLFWLDKRWSHFLRDAPLA